MKLWQSVKNVWNGDTEGPDRGSRLGRPLLLLRETARGFTNDDILNQATALAYKTLVAMVPVLAISLAVVAMLEPPANQPDAVSYKAYFLQAFRATIPAVGGKEDFVNSVESFASNARAIAGVSILFLFWAGYTLLASVEGTFNRIWRTAGRRPRLNRLTAFIATVIIVPVAMSFSVYCSAKLAVAAKQIAAKLPAIDRLYGSAASSNDGGQAAATTGESAIGKADVKSEDKGTASAQPAKDNTSAQAGSGPAPHATTQSENWQGWLVEAVLALSSLLTSCLALAALNYFMPFTPVRPLAALAGGVLSGILFEAAKYLFRYYAVELTANYSQIYGPLLAVPFFLLWLWLAWAIVLLGAKVAFVAQNFRDLAERAELERRGLAYQTYLAVRTVLAASEFFHRGEPPSNFIDHVSARLGMPPYAVRRAIASLVEGGVLRQVTPGTEMYLPAKDIAVLTVGEVVRALSGNSLAVPAQPDDAVRRQLASLFSQADKVTRQSLDACAFAELVKAASPEPAASRQA